MSAIALSLGSCATNAPSSNSDSPAQSSLATTTDEFQVVTTFLPITQFTKAVAGDRAKVTQRLSTNVSPHDYQANPEDAQRLVNADGLVQNGLEMEEFLEDLIRGNGAVGRDFFNGNGIPPSVLTSWINSLQVLELPAMLGSANTKEIPVKAIATIIYIMLYFVT